MTRKIKAEKTGSTLIRKAKNAFGIDTLAVRASAITVAMRLQRMAITITAAV